MSASTAAPARMTTAELTARLRRHYLKPGEVLPGGIFLTEVTLGRAGGSRADALYVGFTSTSGRLLVGHELKVTRSDWLRELAQPGKADPWADECHAFYVVAAPDVAKPEELPDGWGLMVPGATTRTRLDVVVKARSHPERQPSWQAVRSLLAVADTERARLITEARAKAGEDARRDVDRLLEQRLAHARNRTDADRADALAAQLAELTEALGLRVSGETYRRDTATLDELRAAAGFLRAHVGAGRAAAELTGRYGPPTANLRRNLDELDARLAELRAHAT